VEQSLYKPNHVHIGQLTPPLTPEHSSQDELYQDVNKLGDIPYSEFLTAINTGILEEDVPSIGSEDKQYTELRPLNSEPLDETAAKLVLHPENLVVITDQQNDVDSILSQSTNISKIIILGSALPFDNFSKTITFNDIQGTTDSFDEFAPKIPTTTSTLQEVPQSSNLSVGLPSPPYDDISPLVSPNSTLTSPPLLYQDTTMKQEFITQDCNHQEVPLKTAKENIDPGDLSSLLNTQSQDPPMAQEFITLDYNFQDLPLKTAKENIDPGDLPTHINIPSYKVIKTGVLSTKVEGKPPDTTISEKLYLNIDDESSNAFDELFSELLENAADELEGHTSTKRKRKSGNGSSNKRKKKNSESSGYVSGSSADDAGPVKATKAIKAKSTKTTKPKLTAEEKKKDVQNRNNIASELYRRKKKERIEEMNKELKELKVVNAQLKNKCSLVESQRDWLKNMVYSVYNK